MKATSPIRLAALLFPVCLSWSQAAPAASVSTPVPSPAPSTALAKPTPTSVRPAGGDTSKALIVHKPMPSPHWGKVIQYRKEQSFSFVEKDRETLHEFVFQDDSGIIRTAIYHESPKGEGFWEVLVWDQ